MEGLKKAHVRYWVVVALALCAAGLAEAGVAVVYDVDPHTQVDAQLSHEAGFVEPSLDSTVVVEQQKTVPLELQPKLPHELTQADLYPTLLETAEKEGEETLSDVPVVQDWDPVNENTVHPRFTNEDLGHNLKEAGAPPLKETFDEPKEMAMEPVLDNDEDSDMTNGVSMLQLSEDDQHMENNDDDSFMLESSMEEEESNQVELAKEDPASLSEDPVEQFQVEQVQTEADLDTSLLAVLQRESEKEDARDVVQRTHEQVVGEEEASTGSAEAAAASVKSKADVRSMFNVEHDEADTNSFEVDKESPTDMERELPKVGAELSDEDVESFEAVPEEAAQSDDEAEIGTEDMQEAEDDADAMTDLQ